MSNPKRRGMLAILLVFSLFSLFTTADARNFYARTSNCYYVSMPTPVYQLAQAIADQAQPVQSDVQPAIDKLVAQVAVDNVPKNPVPQALADAKLFGTPVANPSPVEEHGTGYISPPNLAQLKAEKYAEHGRMLKAMMLNTDTLPARYISPYQIAQQNQGGCGDCWCVSASVVASGALIANGQLPPYSSTLSDGSNVISAGSTMWCVRTGGCNGDDASTVFNQGKTNGLSTCKEYGPRQDTDRGTCSSSAKKYMLTQWGYADTDGDGSSSYAETKAAIAKYGLVVLTNDAGALGDGNSLVTSRGRGTNHQIAGVGWDDSLNNGQGAILGKNQWGNWGLGIDGQPGPGYVWIANLGTSLAASCSSEVLWCQAGDGPVPPGPPAPTNLLAIAKATTEIDLTWAAPAVAPSGLAAYNVYRNGTVYDHTVGTAYADTKCVPATTYTYTVTVIDTSGNESAQSVAAVQTTPAVPPKPPEPLVANVTVSVMAEASASHGPIFITDASKSTGYVGAPVFCMIPEPVAGPFVDPAGRQMYVAAPNLTTATVMQTVVAVVTDGQGNFKAAVATVAVPGQPAKAE